MYPQTNLIVALLHKVTVGLQSSKRPAFEINYLCTMFSSRIGLATEYPRSQHDQTTLYVFWFSPCFHLFPLFLAKHVISVLSQKQSMKFWFCTAYVAPPYYNTSKKNPLSSRLKKRRMPKLQNLVINIYPAEPKGSPRSQSASQPASQPAPFLILRFCVVFWCSRGFEDL